MKPLQGSTALIRDVVGASSPRQNPQPQIQWAADIEHDGAGSGARDTLNHLRRQIRHMDRSTLASLPHVTVTVYNEHTKANETYSGVPLIALLAPLGVSEHPRARICGLRGAEGSDSTKWCTRAARSPRTVSILRSSWPNGEWQAADRRWAAQR